LPSGVAVSTCYGTFPETVVMREITSTYNEDSLGAKSQRSYLPIEDSLVRLMHHDLSDLGLIVLVKK